MLVSYNWLKIYFEEDLPKPNELADILNTRAYEVEKVEEKNGDYIIDIDVLPNRAHDSLSHIGIAREIATLTGLKCEVKTDKGEFGSGNSTKVVVEEPELCKRYGLLELRSVNITESAPHMSAALENFGQRSINSVVDMTNLVMLETGQPMHAFDMDKLDGDIVVRKAKSGEKITTLDNKEVELDEEILIIADQSGPLAIAGVKGGKKAEVDMNTKNVVFESANFDQTTVRKTSQKIGIKTDSSKRFENGVSPELVEKGMRTIAMLCESGIPEAELGEFVDFYPEKQQQVTVDVSLDKIQKLLGVDISEKETEEVLGKLGFDYENNSSVFSVKAPYERLDISIPEDVVEEIGRVYGYENIEEKPVEMDFTPKLNKEYYYNNLIRKVLYEQGFSEVMTSSFREKGDLEVLKPANHEVPFLRTNLQDGMQDVLERNLHNIDLLGLTNLRVFEIGKIFPKGEERLVLCLGFAGNKKEFPNISELLSEIITEVKFEEHNGVYSLNLDELYSKLPEPKEYVELPKDKLEPYKPFSQYPFVLRDIAVWVPEDTDKEELLSLIKENAGELLVQHRLFDEFSKEGRTSYAYRLVFQSFEKTLTDEEVGEIMKGIESKINEKGWEVR